jgi:hypothetical protein
MKKSRFTIPLLIILAAAVLSLSFVSAETSAHTQKYDLKYKLTKGTKFTLSSTGSSEIITDQMGTEVVTNITGSGADHYVVLDTGEILSLELEYGERTQDMESDQGSASTDFSDLIGKKAKFKMKLDGEVTEYEGFDALPEITTSTQETMTAELYQLGVKGTFYRLPENPVAIGESWTHDETNEIPLEGNVITSTSTATYTVVEEIQKDGFDCLKIEVKGTDKTQGSLQQGGMDLTIERETNSSGIIYFAYKEGMFIYAEAESKGEGIITVEQAGVELPQTINGKGSVTVKIER